ncbi:MAG: hypothetical protein O3C21_20875 [Verrucomicrobia bacterium]|nr:hypothetical protein [Verrucomicrobiota bacterium]
MDRSYAKKGLLLIGAESQESPIAEIQKIVDENRVKFPITNGASGPIDVPGIPHMFVFDTKGKLVFSGHPGNEEAEKAIRKSLKVATGTEGDTASSGKSSSLDVFQRKDLVAERSWTNSDGRALVASLISLSGTTGTFRRPDGRTFEFDITKLSEDDQKMITAAQEGEDK